MLHLVTLAFLITLVFGQSLKGQSNLVTVKKGEDVKFYCPEKLSSIDESLVWYLNDSLVNRTIHGRLNFDIERNLININNVHSEDEGTWAVRANSHEENQPQDCWEQNWCNFTLEILVDAKLRGDQQSKNSMVAGRPPQFKKLELMTANQNMTKINGESVTFKCDVYGYPTPDITWSKNGEEILNGSLKRRKWLLKLETITEQDSGEYTCIVSNIHGSLNFTFSLTVKDVPKKPVKLLGIQNVAVRSGDTARLNCSLPPQDRLSHVKWLLRVQVNGSFVDSTGAPFYDELDVDDSNGRDRRILSIDNVTVEDYGKYVCKVENQLVTYVQTFWLVTVEDAEESDNQRRIYLASVIGATGVIVVILSIASAFIITRRNRNGNHDLRDTRADNNPSVLSCGDPNSPLPSRLKEDVATPVEIS